MGAPDTLTKAAVHKWETGDTENMKNDTFILLAQALGTDPQYILWGADRAPADRPPDRTVPRTTSRPRKG